MTQIAIDGPAGAGKSTVAKNIARAKNYMYVDTGAMYRVIGMSCLNKNIDLQDEEAVSSCCKAADIDIRYINQVQRMYLDGVDVTESIRAEQVGNAASAVSKYAAVRERLVSMQRALGEKYDVVMDGRDIGTQVLVNADLKIYLTASVECRAERRYKELTDKGESCCYEDIKNDIAQRDYNDMTRAISPLKKADDAVEIDSSDMNVEQVCAEIIRLLEEKNGNKAC